MIFSSMQNLTPLVHEPKGASRDLNTVDVYLPDTLLIFSYSGSLCSAFHV